MNTYFDFSSIPKYITHIKIDIGLGMNNIHSNDWLKYEKNLFVFMFEPNVDSKNSSLININKIEHTIKQNNNAFVVIPVALSNVENETSMNFFSMLKDGGHQVCINQLI